jgi:hypothetical protein
MGRGRLSNLGGKKAPPYTKKSGGRKRPRKGK